MDTFEIREIAQEVYVLIKSLITKSNTDRWMDMKEACRYNSLSHSTIRRSIQKGTLKASHSTGRYLFKKSDIDRWLSK